MGYFILLVLMLTFIGVAFHSLVKGYLVQDAQQSLLREAKAIAEIAAHMPLDGNSPLRRFDHFEVGRRRIMLTGRFTDGDYIITDFQLRIVDSSREDTFPPGSVLQGSIADAIAREGLGQGQAMRFSTSDFVVVAVPVKKPVSGIKGAVILLTPIGTLREISAQIARLMLMALGAAGLLAVLLSVVLARGITKPVRMLTERTNSIASRDFSRRVDIRTGDEIEELAASFNYMAAKLQEYDSAQKKLVQNISHELKTPLMSIQGYAEAIRDGVIDREEMDRGLGIVIRESQRLKKMVEDIIYLSRLESCEERYNLSSVELEEVIHEAVETVRSLALEKGIQVQFEPGGLNCVSGDGEKLMRVFVNILSNAVRYASSVVRVRVEQLEDRRIKVVVEDDGPGFSRKDLENLFQRFYKGDGGGSGLGLAIARAIVDKHGGKIHAENSEQGGGRMEVILPKHLQLEPAD